jgi:alcohol dehydrogenase, propanol-preferring
LTVACFWHVLLGERNATREASMRAVKLVAPNTLALQDIPVPEPRPDEVLVKITGAGLCHSDLHVLRNSANLPSYGRTIGHEGAGTVAALGPGATGFELGASVLVSLIYSCGSCRACAEGRENACAVAGSRLRPPWTPGLGPDGAMAEYMVVKSRFLDPLGDLDPVAAAPLADAGATPMHAVNSAWHRLTPGATAVVIAVGGLGHLGLQILKATTAARVIAVDADPAKLELAARLGADLVLANDASTAQRILDETGGYGADVVFDFAGVQPTLDLAVECIGPEGLLRLVGLGGGTFAYGSGPAARPLPWGVNLQRSYGGTHADQLQVIALAQQGRLHVEAVTYPLEEFKQAFADLEAGRVPGRAVLTP